MTQKVTIAAKLVWPGEEYVPALLVGRSMVTLDLTITAKIDIPADADIMVRAREIFSQSTFEYRRPFGTAIAAGNTKTVTADFTPQELKLKPGCWVLVIDLLKKGKSLCGVDVGCAVAYIMHEGESRLHARGSYNYALEEFIWDPDYSVVYGGWKEELPATGDPYDPANAERMFKEFIVDGPVYIEHWHDGVQAPAVAAQVFGALGEKDRWKHCDKMARRAVTSIRDFVQTENGKMYGYASKADGRKRSCHLIAHDTMLMRGLCQSYFYFKFGEGNDPEFAHEIIEILRKNYDALKHAPLVWGWGWNQADCKVYDGRVLAGFAWYCLAYKAEFGEYPGQNVEIPGDVGNVGVDKVFQIAQKYAAQVMANDGWFDAGCFVEVDSHVFAGNMNLLMGLIPTLRMVRPLKSDNPDEPAAYVSGQAAFISPAIEQATRKAFEFITVTGGKISGVGMPPTFTLLSCGSGYRWAAIYIYQICDDYLKYIGSNRAMPWDEIGALREAVAELMTGRTTALCERSASAVALLHCPEFRKLKKTMPWDE